MLYGRLWFIFAKITVVEVGHRKACKGEKSRLGTWVLHTLPEEVKMACPAQAWFTGGVLTQEDRLCEREAVTAAVCM